MRSDPGGIQTAVNGKHFKPVGILSISWDDSNWTACDAANLTYSSTFTNPGDPLISIGSGVETFIEFDLLNDDGALSTLKRENDGNPVLYNKKVKLDYGFLGTNKVRVFEGRITDFTETAKGEYIHVTAKDYGKTNLAQRRASTQILSNKRVDEWLETLANAANMTLTRHGYGLLTIPFVWLEDESILEQMIKAAQAEGAIVYVGTDGNVHYVSPLFWATDPTHSTSQWSLNANTDFETLTLKGRERNQYDNIYITYQNRYLGLNKEVYTLDRYIVIPSAPPGGGTGSTRVTFKFTEPMYSLHEVSFTVTDSVGQDMTSNITWNGRPSPSENDGYLYAQHWDMTIDNNDPKRNAYLLKLRIIGRPVLGGPDEEYKTAGGTDNRVYRIASNEYIQTEEQAKVLAELLKDRFVDNPRLIVNLTGVKPNPLLEVGDFITLTESNTHITNRGFYVTKIEYKLPDGRMQLELVDATGYFQSNNYFTFGSSHWNNADGVLFI
jgi:hypothetical protein